MRGGTLKGAWGDAAPGGPTERGWAFAVAGIVLAAGAVAIVLLRDETELGLDLIALITIGTAVVAFVVGFALGHYADRDIRPGRGGSRD